MKTVQIIVASTRPNRAGLPVANWVYAEAQKQSDIKFELIDLARVKLPFLDEPKSPSDGDYQHEHTKRWSETIKQADGYIIVTAEYNRGYPAPLKNALDTLYSEWEGKPVGLVAYSNGAGSGFRVVEQLLPVLHILGLHALRAKVNLPRVSATNDQPYKAEEWAIKSLERLFAELKQALA